MKVAITTKKELQNPYLKLYLNLDNGANYIKLTYTCSKCAGYGCRHTGDGCDDNVKLEPEEVLSTLGADAKPILEELFNRILNGKSNE